MRDTSLSSQQPGTTDRSTEFPECPHLLRLPPTGLEYPRLFSGERPERHFRYLLPRRRPAGPKEATLLAASSPPILGVEMTGLSYTEMEGCRNLLSLLDNDEIMALCDTITNRLVQPEDRQGKGRPHPPTPKGWPSLLWPRSAHSLPECVSGGRGRSRSRPVRDCTWTEPPGIVASIAAVLPRSHPWLIPASPSTGGNGGLKMALLSRF